MKKLINMKKAFFLLFLTIIYSCSTSYTQIATISSNDVKLYDNGDYCYSDQFVNISYDFWSSYGKMNFIVTNNTDEDIILDLNKSNFIDNGYAYDYYQGRTFYYSKNVSQKFQITKQEEITEAIEAIALYLSYNNLSNTSYQPIIYTNNTVNNTTSNGISSRYSIEYKEKEYIRIPAHTAKAFKEFNITDNVYRKCGLVRNPSTSEYAAKDFNEDNSPKIFSNVLTFIINGKEIKVHNRFYVSEFRNIGDNNVYETFYPKNCKGRKKGNNKIKFNKFTAPNKFYISYSIKPNDDKDRTRGQNHTILKYSRGF